MTTGPDDRRSRKRFATRQAISDVAMRLFVERGFENVTVDEIAAAADVGRMTEEGRDAVRSLLWTKAAPA